MIPPVDWRCGCIAFLRVTSVGLLIAVIATVELSGSGGRSLFGIGAASAQFVADKRGNRALVEQKLALLEQLLRNRAEKKSTQNHPQGRENLKRAKIKARTAKKNWRLEKSPKLKPFSTKHSNKFPSRLRPDMGIAAGQLAKNGLYSTS